MHPIVFLHANSFLLIYPDTFVFVCPWNSIMIHVQVKMVCRPRCVETDNRPHGCVQTQGGSDKTLGIFKQICSVTVRVEYTNSASSCSMRLHFVFVCLNRIAPKRCFPLLWKQNIDVPPRCLKRWSRRLMAGSLSSGDRQVQEQPNLVRLTTRSVEILLQQNSIDTERNTDAVSLAVQPKHRQPQTAKCSQTTTFSPKLQHADQKTVETVHSNWVINTLEVPFFVFSPRKRWLFTQGFIEPTVPQVFSVVNCLSDCNKGARCSVGCWPSFTYSEYGPRSGRSTNNNNNNSNNSALAAHFLLIFIRTESQSLWFLHKHRLWISSRRKGRCES